MSDKKTGTDYITAFKEIVSASLGIVIVIGTLVLLWPQLTKPTPDITTAQAIFSILGGWGGVVIGYYFGRLPAEKATKSAEANAAASEEKKDQAVMQSHTNLVNFEAQLDTKLKALELYEKEISALEKEVSQLP